MWVDASANRVATVYANAPLCNRQLTERRILDGRRHGKAHFACGPHQRAHSACERSHGVRFSVRVWSQNALFRRVRFSSPAQTWSHLTQRRILRRRPHVKAQSGGVTLTQKRILHRRRHGEAHFACGPHQKAHSACERWLRREAIFADLCTLLRPTAARTTGRGHGSHDVDGPMAPVMPERSGLRPTPPGR